MLHNDKWNHIKSDKRICEFLSSWCRFNGGMDTSAHSDINFAVLIGLVLKYFTVVAS